MAKHRLKKDLLIGDRIYGSDSIVDMKDPGRAKFMVAIGHAEIVSEDMPLTVLPPLPRPVRTNQANEIGEVIADALRKGMVFPKEEAKSGAKS